MVIKNEFELGSTVYLKTDVDQKARIVICIHVDIDRCVMYELVCETQEIRHYSFEISAEKNVLITSDN